MKFPWTRRAEKAHDEGVAADEQLVRIRADWKRVNEGAAETHKERTANNWTATVRILFSGK